MWMKNRDKAKNTEVGEKRNWFPNIELAAIIICTLAFLTITTINMKLFVNRDQKKMVEKLNALQNQMEQTIDIGEKQKEMIETAVALKENGYKIFFNGNEVQEIPEQVIENYEDYTIVLDATGHQVFLDATGHQVFLIK